MFFRPVWRPCAFQVDQSLQTGLTPGMKLEVCVRTERDGPYWVANIITTCGQLLLLRYEGYQDDRRADFWCDIMTADLHPLGWSRQQGKTMRAPEGEGWSLFSCFVLFIRAFIDAPKRASDMNHLGNERNNISAIFTCFLFKMCRIFYIFCLCDLVLPLVKLQGQTTCG